MKQQVHFQVANEVKTVLIERAPDMISVTIGDKTYQAVIRQQVGNRWLLEVDGQNLQIYLATDGDRCYIWLDGNTWTLQRLPEENNQLASQRALAPSATMGNLTATMPGLVREVLVAAGDRVVRGATLVILEAMKMELRISAPQDGQIAKVHCTSGQAVARNQLLIEFSEQ
ncbi:hypothetical protein BH10CHL1_BH10CHL1_09210 [soil metagenome]